ncbi:hypothetical protein AAHA92_25614 [Salvia divinorum]|uniref:Secreted protein n=1 Tax=Salvia divinorum TaxID=28513 RepID=A0ABD1GCF3_SALDI
MSVLYPRSRRLSVAPVRFPPAAALAALVALCCVTVARDSAPTLPLPAPPGFVELSRRRCLEKEQLSLGLGCSVLICGWGEVRRMAEVGDWS